MWNFVCDFYFLLAANMDLEKGSSTAYVSADDDYAYQTSSSKMDVMSRQFTSHFLALSKEQLILFVLCIILLVC